MNRRGDPRIARHKNIRGKREKVNLRPHHILCIAHYEGKGYGKEFCEKMREVISALDTGESFTVTDGADDLCTVCPNHQNGVCTAEEKASRYDDAVKNLLGMTKGEKYTKKQISALAKKNVYSAGRFDSVCHDCEWAYICHKK